MTPMIIWLAVVALTIVAFITRIADMRRAKKMLLLTKIGPIEIGSESDEIFVPGDPEPNESQDEVEQVVQ